MDGNSRTLSDDYSSMIEFVGLIALAVLLLGLGVLAGAGLLTALGWLVVTGVRRSGLIGVESRDRRHRPPGE